MAKTIDEMWSQDWRPLPDGYWISENGHVARNAFRRCRPGRRGHRLIWDVLSIPSRANHAGYLRVWMNSRLQMVHRLVLEAFVGKCPANHQCDHIDRNRRNNHILNLRWVTRTENRANTTIGFLTLEQVREIRATYKRRHGEIVRMATQYGVSTNTIGYVVRKQTWKDIV